MLPKLFAKASETAAQTGSSSFLAAARVPGRMLGEAARPGGLSVPCPLPSCGALASRRSPASQYPTPRPPAHLRKRKMGLGGSMSWASGTLGSKCGPSSSSSPGCSFSASSKMNMLWWQRRHVSCICHRNSSCTGHRELQPRRVGSFFLSAGAVEHRGWAPPTTTTKPKAWLPPHEAANPPR